MDKHLLRLLKDLREALAPAELNLEAASAVSKVSEDFADACPKLAAHPLRRRDELLS
jgi:hypothetical protein